MTSWKVKLGGALGMLATSLIGLSIVPGSTSMTAAENTKWILIFGLVCQAASHFFLLFGRDNDTTSEDVAAIRLSKLLDKSLDRVTTPSDTAEIKKLQARIESVEPVKPL